MGATREELLNLADFWESRGDHAEAARLRRSARPKVKHCPECGGTVRLELSVNFLVCNSCAEMLYVNELVP